MGALFGASGYLISTGKDEYGHTIAAATGLGLVAMAGPAFVSKTGRWYPGGILAISGALSGMYHAAKAATSWKAALE
jgi:uncharacterized membrane protein (UPF0136 family)